ncbi:DUF3037 domain-containing protein [Apilactobacillus xinyiensis]|uniref:DUF3037 domain-containing protein n=1 Tax=Apilactobacillus xinyiensis TaxID=2841032 RepID=UPI001C7D1CE2|nr:DUF3037 domain-containing protein [Apilactobacillus xinyiensis]
MKINYMILRYIPSFIRKENVIVGIVIHVPENGTSNFFQTEAYKRVHFFDDELDKEMFSADMDSFHEAFDFPYYKNKLDQIGHFNFDDISDDNFLKNRNNNYANEYRFDNPNFIDAEKNELDEEIERLKDIYLHYDKPKDQRTDNKKLKRTISKILKNKFSKQDLNNNIGKYKDPIGKMNIFDYEIKNTFYRVLTFDYKNTNYLLNEIEVSLFKIGNIMNSSDKDPVNVIFVVNNDYEKNKEIYDSFCNYIQSHFSDGNINIQVMKVIDFVQGNKKIIV